MKLLNKNIIIPGIILLAFTLTAIFAGFKIGNHYQAAKTAAIKVQYDAEHAALQKVSDQNTTFAQAAANVITREQFKDMFKDEFTLFANDLNLKVINHYTKLQTTTENNVNTMLRDSTIVRRDTLRVKTFNFTTSSLQFKGYATSDSIFATWKHYLQLQIADGKEARKGFWNKITLQPFKRNKIVQAVSSDSNTVITHIQSVKIK